MTIGFGMTDNGQHKVEQGIEDLQSPAGEEGLKGTGKGKGTQTGKVKS